VPVVQTPASGAVLEINALRSDLTERLPDYMLPAAFVLLDALSLAASGKLDRKALPAPIPLPEPTSFVPPSSELEQAIARVWRQVLGVHSVGVHDNFFDLGGHSLAMARTNTRRASATPRHEP
jgi:Phosphopantetheine attachment site